MKSDWTTTQMNCHAVVNWFTALFYFFQTHLLESGFIHLLWQRSTLQIILLLFVKHSTVFLLQLNTDGNEMDKPFLVEWMACWCFPRLWKAKMTIHINVSHLTKWVLVHRELLQCEFLAFFDVSLTYNSYVLEIIIECVDYSYSFEKDRIS